MMRQTYLLLFLIILFISNAFGQNENDNCPPLFTRSKIKISKATITRIEVVDSNKFTKLPEFVLSLDSLSKLIKGPEIAARAGVTGDAIIKINFNGYVSSASILRGIGAGCDEATLEVLMKSKFHPAKIGDEKAESEIKVWVNFYLIEIIDEPDIYIDEIKYEVYYNLIKNQTVPEV